jgi:hypothetical protein
MKLYGIIQFIIDIVRGELDMRIKRSNYSVQLNILLAGCTEVN